MKKIFSALLIITSLGFSIQARAQNKDYRFSMNLGADALMPVGKTVEYDGFSYGATLQAVYQFSPKIQVTASGAYTVVTPAKLYRELWEPWMGGNKFPNMVFFPVKAGLKYDVYKNFYVGAEAGVSIPKDSTRVTSFAYSGGIGTKLPVSSRAAVDVSLRYEAWALNVNSVTSFTALRVAYSFGLKK